VNKKASILKSVFIALVLIALFIGALSSAFSPATASALTEAIPYSFKTDTGNVYIPGVKGGGDIPCAPLAGTILVDFYSRQFPELVPTTIGINIFTREQVSGPNIFKTAEELTRLMQTRPDGGTLQGNFAIGLRAYVEQRGFRINYHSAPMQTTRTMMFFTQSVFCFDGYISEINAGRPVAISARHLNTVRITENAGFDMQTLRRHSQGHKTIGYGYRVIKYYRAEMTTVRTPTMFNPFATSTVMTNTLVRTSRFLIISEAFDEHIYMNIDRDIDIADAFGVSIFR
jgi:hypothetical protein